MPDQGSTVPTTDVKPAPTSDDQKPKTETPKATEQSPDATKPADADKERKIA